MKNLNFIGLLFILFCAPALSQNRLEKKVIKAVEQNESQYRQLLLNIVNMNSGTMNFDGVYNVGQVLIAEFKKLGMTSEWIPGKDWGRAGHVVARTEGNEDKPGILLIGHLDTVFEPSSPFQKYQMLSDEIIKGPGTADMKGGDVVILLALKALNDAGMLHKLNIEVILTGDEEKSGSPIELSKRDLVEAAKRMDYALGFENADGNHKTVTVARRGSLGWKLTVTGNPAHSSQIFTEKVGTGAIYEASRILNEFYLQLSKEPNLTFNPGYIIGGTEVKENQNGIAGGLANGKSNVVSETAIVHGDLRAISPEQVELAQKTMFEIVQNNYPGTSATLVFKEGGYPPFPPKRENYMLLSLYSKVSEDLGYGTVQPVDPRNAGAADISFTTGLVKAGIDGLGLTGGSDDHTINETANITHLEMQAKRAAILMLRLSNSDLK